MTTSIPKKPFSMIREFQLADWFTLANAVCGTGAIFSMMTYLQMPDVIHICFASGLVLTALVFDFLDGRVARWRHKTSLLGRELDSLADVISFGVAPAINRVSVSALSPQNSSTLPLDESQKVGVNRVGLSRGHAVRKALVGFQCAIPQQLCRQRCRIGIRHDLVVIAMHH